MDSGVICRAKISGVDIGLDSKELGHWLWYGVTSIKEACFTLPRVDTTMWHSKLLYLKHFALKKTKRESSEFRSEWVGTHSGFESS